MLVPLLKTKKSLELVFLSHSLLNFWRRDVEQHWNNVAFVNVVIYKVEQRWINLTYFDIDINNIWQYQNNVDQHQNNAVWIWPKGRKKNPKKSRPITYFWASNKNRQELNMLNSKFDKYFKNLFTLFSI